MAIPSVGGMAIQLITLFIAPCIYCMVKEREFQNLISAEGTRGLVQTEPNEISSSAAKD
jgi:hypothetical protein